MNELVEEILKAIQQLKKDILELEKEEDQFLFTADDYDEKEDEVLE